MNDLQLALALLAAVVLAAVVAHGAWTSRRSRPKQAEPQTEGPDASTLDFSLPAHPDGGEPAMGGTDRAGSFEALGLPKREPGLDPLIDVIAPISFEGMVSGEAALAALPTTRRVGTKPFALEGLSAATGLWEVPAAGQRYSAFQAGIQLANRVGAMNQIEFSEFVTRTREFADAIGGEAEFPDMLEEVARARELDQFAGAHDAQLSFTLRARKAAWSPGYVQQQAARLGFVAGVIPGRMVVPAKTDGQPPILVLSFDAQAALADEPDKAALRQIVLSLDVPQVAQEDKPFARMCEIALALAASMEGAITDDNGNAIRADTMDSIHADLLQLYETLQSRDLPVGSDLCRRLFS
jgi:hypothetical protein